METSEQPETDQPVAYNTNGQPLYLHPQSKAETKDSVTQPQAVHISRPAEPEKLVISDVIKLKHERSAQMFPYLNLSDGEYIISAVRRHPIGLFFPFLIGFFLVFISAVVLVNYQQIAISVQIDDSIGQYAIGLPVILFIILVLLGMYVVYTVYTNNKFFLTNESVIQEIQTTVFSKHEQTVSLMDIEDASFTRNGIIQQIFNYGSIRLSTEGDETTYRFTYVANPKQHIAKLTNAVEAFKNGRPVE